MIIQPRLWFIKDDGKWEWPEKEIQRFLKSLPFGKYEIIIRKPRKPSSDPQRKYYWKVIMGLVADETGCEPLEVHMFCKQTFLPIDRSSTEELTTTEREDYHSKIREYFSREFNIYIPLPNEAQF